MESDQRRRLGVKFPCLDLLHDPGVNVDQLGELFLRASRELTFALDVLAQAREQRKVSLFSRRRHASYWRLCGLTNTPQSGVCYLSVPTRIPIPEAWPHVVRGKRSEVRVYQVRSPKNRGGISYTLTWKIGRHRERQNVADLQSALSEAQLKCNQLDAQRWDEAKISRVHREVLFAAIGVANEMGLPLDRILSEWVTAWVITEGNVLHACSPLVLKPSRKDP